MATLLAPVGGQRGPLPSRFSVLSTRVDTPWRGESGASSLSARDRGRTSEIGTNERSWTAAADDSGTDAHVTARHGWIQLPAVAKSYS
jgi:hypothetical protein